MAKDRNRPKRNALKARDKRHNSKERRIKKSNKRRTVFNKAIMVAWDERHKPVDITKILS